MTYLFPKSLRIKKSHQFKSALLKGVELKGRFLVLCLHQRSTLEKAQFGVIASKHFGNAVQRNRFKRVAREAFRLSSSRFPHGLQLIFKPRKYAIQASMHEILEELKSLAHVILEMKKVNPFMKWG